MMSERYFSCITNKPPYAYVCGETMRFTVELLEDGVPLPGVAIQWELNGDYGVHQCGRAVSNAPFVVEGTIRQPGFIQLNAWAVDEDDEKRTDVTPLEAGAGAAIDSIAAVSEKPADYDAFWNRCKTELATVPPVLLSRTSMETPEKHPNHRVYDVRIACAGGTAVSGILTIPPGDGPFAARTSYQGYGVKSAWTECFPDEICLCINAHGIENNMPDRYYTELAGGRLNGYGFDPVENQSPDTCYFKNMMLRAAQALRYLTTLPQWDGEHLTAWGGSQGAVQAMHGTYLVPEVTKLDIFVPWLCDLQAGTAGRRNNWGNFPRDAVRYFDLSLRAPDIRCPVTVKLGLGDQTSPPTGVCAMYNRLNTAKTLHVVQSMGHNNPTPDARIWNVSKR